MIQVPLNLYFTSHKQFKCICTKCTRTVSHVSLAKGFLRTSTYPTIYYKCQREVKILQFLKAKIKDPTVQYKTSSMTFAEFVFNEVARCWLY